MLVDSANN